MDFFLNTVLPMLVFTLAPALLTLVFTLIRRKTNFQKENAYLEQIIIGVAFGVLAILNTQFGPVIGGDNQVIINVRNGAIMTAGLVFGAPAGFIAGLIGGLYRFIYPFIMGEPTGFAWLASSLVTFLAGLDAAVIRILVFDNKRAPILAGIGLGAATEVFHMLLLLVFNLSNVNQAFTFVETAANWMLACTGISIGLAIIVNGFGEKREKGDIKEKVSHLGYSLGLRVVLCAIICFAITAVFVVLVITRVNIGEGDVDSYRHVTIYLVIFTEILAFTSIFMVMYNMMKKKIISNIEKVNKGLDSITKGNLDTVVNVRSFKEFSDLSDDINATVTTLKGYIKDAETKMAKELEMAHQIQTSALPSVFPPFPNRKEFDIYASMDAAKEVGGDFYDFFFVGSYQLGILIADVSGKGVPAAMFMMNAKSLIKGLVESGKPIDEVMGEANKELCENNDAEMFITAWLGVLDTRNGELSFVNAGHNPPVLINHLTNDVEFVKSRPNLVLGGLDFTKYDIHKLKIEPGDELFLYTDGVTEAQDRSNRLYGEDRLLHKLKELGADDPTLVCKAIKKDVEEFAGSAPQSDDITMLSLRVNAHQSTNYLKTVATEEALQLIPKFIEERLSTSRLGPSLLSKMQVSTDEILSNIIFYSGSKYVKAEMIRTDEGFDLKITDDGKAFDPFSNKDPNINLSVEDRPIGGLGVFLVKKLASSHSYAREGDLNVITLSFKGEETPEKEN